MIRKMTFIVLLFITLGILPPIHAATKVLNDSRDEAAEQLQVLEDALDSKPDPNTDLKMAALPSTEAEASPSGSGSIHGCRRECRSTPYGMRCRYVCPNNQSEPVSTPHQESGSPTPF
jgi:hypothetical protein